MSRSLISRRRRAAGVAVCALALLSAAAVPLGRERAVESQARTVLLRAGEHAAGYYPGGQDQWGRKQVKLPANAGDLAYALSLALAKEYPGLEIVAGGPLDAAEGRVVVDRASYRSPDYARVYADADGKLCQLEIAGVALPPTCQDG